MMHVTDSRSYPNQDGWFVDELRLKRSRYGLVRLTRQGNGQFALALFENPEDSPVETYEVQTAGLEFVGVRGTEDPRRYPEDAREALQHLGYTLIGQGVGQ